jgi:hypothetical protein
MSHTPETMPPKRLSSIRGKVRAVTNRLRIGVRLLPTLTETSSMP